MLTDAASTTTEEHESNVADISDRATISELKFNRDSLAEVRRRVAPESHPDFDGKHCVDCGGDIPEERLEMGRVRCVSCQTVLEHNGRMRRSA